MTCGIGMANAPTGPPRSGGAESRNAASGLRRRRLATDLFARALGDVLPLVGVLVDLGALPGACVLGGATVVLTGLGDAVALLAVLRLRRGLSGGGGGEAEREDSGKGGLDRGLMLHGRVS